MSLLRWPAKHVHIGGGLSCRFKMQVLKDRMLSLYLFNKISGHILRTRLLQPLSKSGDQAVHLDTQIWDNHLWNHPPESDMKPSPGPSVFITPDAHYTSQFQSCSSLNCNFSSIKPMEKKPKKTPNKIYTRFWKDFAGIFKCIKLSLWNLGSMKSGCKFFNASFSLLFT